MSIKKPSHIVPAETHVRVNKRGDEPVLYVEFHLRDGRVFGFPYSHLMHYRLEMGTGPEEKLTLEFSRHDVAITGRRFGELREFLKTGSLASVAEMDPRYENLTSNRPFISTVTVEPISGAVT